MSRQLVLAPLDDFIPKGDDPLLLGVWCRAHPDLANAEIAESPYKTSTSVLVAGEEVERISATLLPQLANRLNSIHETDFSLRDWRILVGPWLQLFVGAAYDRCLRLQNVLHAHPNIDCLLISATDSPPANDTLQYAYALATDRYNLQLMSRLLRAMGKTYPEKSCPFPVTSPESAPPPKKTQGLLRLASRGLGKLFSLFGSYVLLRDSYLPRKCELRLALQNPGKFLPWLPSPISLAAPEPSEEMRSTLSGINLGDTLIERCISLLLPHEIPVSLLENFTAYARTATREYPHSAAVLCSANAWYYDESFKHAAVRNLRNGARLHGIQHGGNYGALELMPFENHETAITDRYYTWGWTSGKSDSVVQPMPAAKLINRPLLGANAQPGDLLWVTTSLPRYLVTYPYIPEYFESYLSWQSRFLSALPQEWRDRLRLRPHYEDNGWNLVQRLKAMAPSLKLEDWQTPFATSLADCSLYICDHLSTTFLEAIAADKPTVLFWEEESNRLRPEALPYYQDLKAAGVLFHSPEEAAIAIQDIAADVETWWRQSERKLAVGRFRQRFARRSADAFREWEREFRQVLSKKKD